MACIGPLTFNAFTLLGFSTLPFQFSKRGVAVEIAIIDNFLLAHVNPGFKPLQDRGGKIDPLPQRLLGSMALSILALGDFKWEAFHRSRLKGIIHAHCVERFYKVHWISPFIGKHRKLFLVEAFVFLAHLITFLWAFCRGLAWPFRRASARASSQPSALALAFRLVCV